MALPESEFQKLEANILSKEVPECGQLVTARVRLCYRMTDDAASIKHTMTCTVTVAYDDTERFRKVKKRLFEAAWLWLGAYYDGAPLDADCPNVFSDICDEDALTNTGGLSSAHEALLQSELREIERDFKLAA